MTQRKNHILKIKVLHLSPGTEITTSLGISTTYCFQCIFKNKEGLLRQPWNYDQNEIYTSKYFSYTDLNVSQKPNYYITLKI